MDCMGAGRWKPTYLAIRSSLCRTIVAYESRTTLCAWGHGSAWRPAVTMASFRTMLQLIRLGPTRRLSTRPVAHTAPIARPVAIPRPIARVYGLLYVLMYSWYHTVACGVRA